MIDLDQQSLATIKSIFETHLPDVQVYAFGSRVTGTAKQFSDLDLVVIGQQSVPIKKMHALKFAFSNSDLPIMIDLVDWHTLSDEFRAVIEANCQQII